MTSAEHWSARMKVVDVPPTVNISDTEIREKNKRFIVYKLAVGSGTNSWSLYRRYNEFNALHEKVKKLCPEAHLKLPGKRLFGNFDPIFIRQRRDGLSDFVQKLMLHPCLRNNEYVIQFFQLESIKHSGIAEEDGSKSFDKTNGTVVNLGPSEKPQVRPGDFEFLKVIGKGSFGKVLLARHKAERRLYAVKVLNKSHIVRRNETRHIMSERNVLVTNLQHPFLVALRYSFQTPHKLYFVLDYVNGGELFFHLQKERCFSEPRARLYAAEIASALGYLHSLSIIYRDLKPENILLDSQGHVVLTDFGLCKEGISGRDTTSTFCGTPEYLAPEVLLKEPYDKTVDWWCLGAVLYEMMFGLPPFYSRNTSEMYEKILYRPLTFQGSTSSPTARLLLQGLLHKDKEHRLGASGDFEEISQHVFFVAINWTLLIEKKVKPLYNPNLNGQMDLKHFDPEFVKEPISSSIEDSSREDLSGVQSADNTFDGFSYVMPDLTS